LENNAQLAFGGMVQKMAGSEKAKPNWPALKLSIPEMRCRKIVDAKARHWAVRYTLSITHLSAAYE